MAFTIIPGSGTAPTTYEGTDGSDLAAIQTAPNGVVVRGLGGNDVINWGTATLVGSTLSGGQGNDIITPNIISGATLIAGLINGNQGNDTIGNPQLGVAATISTVAGGQDNDTIYVGNLQSSLVNGNLGDDVITTGVATGATVNTSDSRIFGGQGNDTINVTAGVAAGYVNTLIDGNLGNDTINVTLDHVTIFQNSTIAGGEGDDRINAFTTAVAVNLDGGAGNDTIRGGRGADTINGGDGADALLGGAGRDTINGGNLDDILIGGADVDTLSGGTGNNRFVQRDGSLTGGVTAASITAADNLVAYNGQGSSYSNGNFFTIAGGADILTDWSAGAVNSFDTGIVGSLVGADTATMSTGQGFAVGNLAFRGTYTASTVTFTLDANGFDVGVVTTTAADAFYRNNFIVLTGAGGTVLNSTDFGVVAPLPS